ncbi:MAG TPA: hypothetical protein VLE73_05665 [Candidatus Saccharimonadales bacterium]|nr:hypothetical protein [Candidatus Saccharimonadales bacterium]
MKDIYKAELQSLASTGLHHLPKTVRERIITNVLDLGGPRDIPLRWHVARGGSGLHGMEWAFDLPPEPAAPHNNPRGGVHKVWMAERELLDLHVKSGRRLAVAYAIGNAVVMGVNQLHPETNFLQPVDEEGSPSKHGAWYGVVLRTGAYGQVAAIGNAPEDGSWQFHAVQTRIAQFEVGDEIPNGLYRV